MSDYEEQVKHTLSAHLSRAYSGLVAICAALPVPIALPTGEVSNLDTTPAVSRVMELAEDQPMPEEQQAHLFASCSFWLGALDLYGLLTLSFSTARGYAVAANILMAESHMEDLGAWLADQR
ncbi:hypothetical protein [Streptomyces odonnellii]|uniref:hypothetical protein n=1 Tax=Streptomyces odonnellii TaxID=1417980 RepID=UPI0006966741|nr:hypothetical protein [Streptomyces odonnellii]